MELLLRIEGFIGGEFTVVQLIDMKFDLLISIVFCTLYNEIFW